MTGSFQISDYREALLFLGTAGIVAPLFRRLKLSPIIGFLLAGAFLGPFGLGRLAGDHPLLRWLSISNVEDMAHLAELGVVFLLFMIGLELSFERLSRMKRLVFGLGSLQLVMTMIVIGACGYGLGLRLAAAIVIGAALALSSTAMAIPALAESRRLGTAAGRTTFAVLLFQDLMVAPLMFLVAMMGREGEYANVSLDVLYALAPAVLALALIVGIGRLALRPLFHLVAQQGSTEFFMAACLLVVLGTSILSALAGMSMALGAFVAGLLLAETEYRREIEVTVAPFQGLLLGLFFVSVGAGLDASLIVSQPLRTLGLAVAFVAVKIIVFYLSARAFRIPHGPALESSLLIGPGGEFAFVLLGLAILDKVIWPSTGTPLALAVTLSMIGAPALAALGRRWGKTKPSANPAPILDIIPTGSEEGRVVIIGFGRVGRLVAEMLTRHEIPFLAVDGDATLVAQARSAGIPIYWGNATRPDFLHRFGLDKARALVITLTKPASTEAIVALARKARAELTIVARARDAAQATHLYEIGATDAIPETIEASLQLSEAVLVDIGVPMGYVIASIHEKRDEFRKILQPRLDEDRQRRAIRMSQRVKRMARAKKPLEDPKGSP